MVITQINRRFRNIDDEELDNIIYLRYTTRNKLLGTNNYHMVHLPANKENILELVQYNKESIKQYVHQKYVNQWRKKVTHVRITHSIMYDIDHAFVEGVKHDDIEYKYMISAHRHDLKNGIPKNLDDEVFVENVGDAFIGPAWNYFTNNKKFINWLKLTRMMDSRYIEFVAITRHALDEFHL